MKRFPIILCSSVLASAALLTSLPAEEEKSDGISGLIDSLKDSVKDMDMGGGIKDLPKQFAQLKKDYAKQAEAFKEMKGQVKEMRAELDLLKKEVATLKSEEIVLETVEE